MSEIEENDDTWNSVNGAAGTGDREEPPLKRARYVSQAWYVRLCIMYLFLVAIRI